MQVTYWDAFLLATFVHFSLDYADRQLCTETMQILFIVSGLDLFHTHMIRFKV